jgi:hypothetical protein
MAEQFSDGVYELSIGRYGYAEFLGTATVTFENGLWSAVLNLTDSEAKDLGIELNVVRTSDPINGVRMMLLAKPLDEEWPA